MQNNDMKIVYSVADIQMLLGIGKSKAYQFLEEVYKSQFPFIVIKIGKLYKIPKRSFDELVKDGMKTRNWFIVREVKYGRKGIQRNHRVFLKSSWYHRKKELTTDGVTHYGKVGGFKIPEEAEQSYYSYQKKYEEDCEKILPKINEEISLKNYIIYWFENVFSKNVEDTTAMITSYVVYSLIIPNITYDIKVRLVTTEFINEILDRIDSLCKTTANKSREVLKMVFKAAVKDKITNYNPVNSANEYRRGKVNITVLSKDEIKKL